MMPVQYPLSLSFKIIAFGPQVFVRDASQRELLFVHQKALKLKEDINVFSDSRRTQQLYNIKADRILDFSATYRMTDSMGNPAGAIKREGMRSLWKASYNIMDAAGNIVAHIKEDNPWIKVADAVLSEIPLVGIAAAYLFHPSYTLYRTGAEMPIMRLTKQAAFFEGKFEVAKLAEPMDQAEETRMLLSLLMMVLLERQRG
jgi:hypothetical protein